jgi:Xaa-Pro aminopeptidase
VTDSEIPPHEFEERRERAQELARERGLAGLVVWSRNATTVDWYGDVMYLANHHTPFPQLPDNLPAWAGRAHSVLVLPVDGDPALVVDTVEYRADLVQVKDVRVGFNVPATVAAVLREKRLADEPLGLVGRESYLLSSHEILRAELGGNVQLAPADDILAILRRRKSEAELSLIRHAGEVGVECMSAMMDAITPGMTEGDVVAEGMKTAAKLGAFPYDVAVASGPHSANFQWARLPSWDTERPLAAGDLIHIDFYGPVRGYYTDFVRSTVVGGEPTADQFELLEGAVEFVESIIDQVRPGVAFGSLWQHGQDWLEANGFRKPVERPPEPEAATLEGMFPGFGHCIGLGGAESPYLMEGVGDTAEEGMVIAVEVLLTQPEVGGVGFEQDVIVTAEGCDVITRGCPARWWGSPNGSAGGSA